MAAVEQVNFSAIAAQLTLSAAIELFAVCREHAELLPDPVWAEAQQFYSVLQEHVEIVP